MERVQPLDMGQQVPVDTAQLALVLMADAIDPSIAVQCWTQKSTGSAIQAGIP